MDLKEPERPENKITRTTPRVIKREVRRVLRLYLKRLRKAILNIRNIFLSPFA
jgi:hypothetical protein